MLYRTIYPVVLVTFQLSMLAYIFISAPYIPSGYAGIFIEVLGIFLGFAAVYANGIGNFNITPRLKEKGKLVTTGPYSFIRHPMYTAQLILVTPLIIDFYSTARLIAVIVLLITLLLKIQYEEKSLRQKFSEYEAYAAKTRMLIPFIF